MPTKYRAITPVSRHMLCIFMAMFQMICRWNFFTQTHRDILKFIYFPEFDNEYYMIDEESGEYNFFNKGTNDQIVYNIYPLFQLTEIATDMFYDLGYSIKE